MWRLNAKITTKMTTHQFHRLQYTESTPRTSTRTHPESQCTWVIPYPARIPRWSLSVPPRWPATVSSTSDSKIRKNQQRRVQGGKSKVFRSSPVVYIVSISHVRVKPTNHKRPPNVHQCLKCTIVAGVKPRLFEGSRCHWTSALEA